MLIEIANELKRIGASIDFIDREQAIEAINAALGATLALLEAMTIEVFYLTTMTKREGIHSTRVVPIFKRFAQYFNTRSASKGGEEYDEYDLTVFKGIWTWVYQEKCDVWIEENTNFENLTNLPNKAVENQSIPQEHLEFYKDTKAVIAIPFEHKIGYSNDVGGILSIEFDRPKLYSSEQHEALNALSDHIGDIIWKSTAWIASKDGTKTVVEDFISLCNAIRNDPLPVKTGLFAPVMSECREVAELVEVAFRGTSIQMDKYDGESDSTELFLHSRDITGVIKKEHFGILDITGSNPNIILILGIMINENMPCMILSNQDNVEKVPSLIDSLAARAGQDESRLLHVYRYEITQNGIQFINTNKTPMQWENVWRDFIEDVKELSPAFRTASDWYP